ncbi:MAG: DUF58 domain-containing protein, partial [Candidatus Aminicenantes bacterium]|nr:DUF58 domain-containing protein [Candidatus Aminicenantes bacterium]
KKSSSEVFSGEYHSAFKGRGMEFSEVREYYPGDEIRFIDWNVSSRMGKIYVKQFVEERELTVILAVDLSSSLDFFSGEKSKKDIAAEISAIIAFTANNNKDKVGLLVFTDKVELYIPPKRGISHLLRIIKEILTFKPESKGTSIENGLTYLNKVIKKKAIVFLISDFIDKDFSLPLRISGRKHDLIAINISDKREVVLPEKGIFRMRDSESGEEFMVDFSSEKTRKKFRILIERENENLKEKFNKYNVDSIDISSEENYEKPLFNFFLKRRKKYSR